MDIDKQTLTSKLNEDLTSELGAIIPYITCAAKVTGHPVGLGRRIAPRGPSRQSNAM
jgi:hypothetical protein